MILCWLHLARLWLSHCGCSPAPCYSWDAMGTWEQSSSSSVGQTSCTLSSVHRHSLLITRSDCRIAEQPAVSSWAIWRPESHNPYEQASQKPHQRKKQPPLCSLSQACNTSPGDSCYLDGSAGFSKRWMFSFASVLPSC